MTNNVILHVHGGDGMSHLISIIIIIISRS